MRTSALRAASFERQLTFGKVGESLIANWFKCRGYAALPVYEIESHTGKGPQLFLQSDELIAPDLLCFNGKKVFWIEAKHKSVFSWHRITKRWVTGIDRRHYHDYLKVAEVSPWPVWLMFLHRSDYTDEPPHNCPSGLFGGELMRLRDNVNHEHANWGKSGMVYWAHGMLDFIAPIGQVVKEAP